ncbi:MAG TPA: DUF5777 family beta-barrel protein [Thermoanaerobaculia bacterium]|nr:DUF5777 family beta-barrel protein [Thermoanaerobaculia bacterium]
MRIFPAAAALFLAAGLVGAQEAPSGAASAPNAPSAAAPGGGAPDAAGVSSDSGERKAAPRPWLAPEGTLVVNLPSDQTLSRGLLQFLVTHRFRGPVRGSNAHSLYSLDSGADFGFGFTYAPVERGEFSLYRSGIQDDWELAAKYAFIPPGRTFGAAVRVGGDDRRDPLVVTDQGGLLPDAKARTSFFAQGVLTIHLWSNRIEVSAVPTYASRTTAERRAFNVPLHAAIALGRSWNLQGEYQFQRKSVPDSIDVFTIGIEKTLYRHRFSLVISNTTVTTVDQYLSGDFAAASKRQGRAFDNGFRNNDWHIGFNLIRQFKP